MPFYSDCVVVTRDSNYRFADAYSPSGITVVYLGETSPYYECHITVSDIWGPARDGEFHAAWSHGVFDSRMNPVTGAVTVGTYPYEGFQPYYAFQLNNTTVLQFDPGNTNGNMVTAAGSVPVNLGCTGRYFTPGYRFAQVLTAASAQGKAYTLLEVGVYQWNGAGFSILKTTSGLTTIAMSDGTNTDWYLSSVVAVSEAHPERVLFYLYKYQINVPAYSLLRVWYDITSGVFSAPVPFGDVTNVANISGSNYNYPQGSYDCAPKMSGGLNYAYALMGRVPGLLEPSGFVRHVCDDSADGWKNPTLDFVNFPVGYFPQPYNLIIVKKSDENIRKIVIVTHPEAPNSTGVYSGYFQFTLYDMEFCSRDTVWNLGKTWLDTRLFHGREVNAQGWWQYDGLPACAVWVQHAFYIDNDGHGTHLIDFFTPPTPVFVDYPISIALEGTSDIQLTAQVVFSESLQLIAGLVWEDTFKTSTGLQLGFQYLLNPNLNYVNFSLNLDAGYFASIVVGHNEYDKYVALPMALDGHLSIVLGDEVIIIVEAEFPIHTHLYGVDLIDGIIDYVNTNSRTTPPLQYFMHAGVDYTPATDVWTQHATDIMETDTVAYDSTNFKVGYQTIAERVALLSGEQIAAAVFISFVTLPDAVTSNDGQFYNDATFPSIANIADSLTAGLAEYTASASTAPVKKLELWMGFCFQKPGANVLPYVPQSGDNGVLAISWMALEASGVTTPGGSGAITIPPTEYWQSVHYMVTGEEYAKDFLFHINATRETYGLQPYKLPTKEIYEIYASDIAQIHSQNQAATGYFGHDDWAPDYLFPEGFGTVEQRLALVRSIGLRGGENVLYSTLKVYFDPTSPFDGWSIDPTQQILTDLTVISPYDAYYAWWTSPGHRENILYDYSAVPENSYNFPSSGNNVYSFLGFAVGVSATVNTLSQELYAPSDRYAVYLTHVILDLEPAVAQFDLSFSCTITGAPITFLEHSWSLKCLTHVKSQHTLPLGPIRLAARHAADYGVQVVATHVAPIHFTVVAQSANLYTQLETVRFQRAAYYAIQEGAVAKNASTSRYSIRLAVGKTARYESFKHPRTQHYSTYSPFPVISVQHRVPYSTLAKLLVPHLSTYSQRALPKAQHFSFYSQLARPKAQHFSFYSQLARPKAQHFSFYSQFSLTRGYHQGKYGDLARFTAQHQSPYTSYSLTVKSLSSGYALRGLVANGFEASWVNTVPVALGHEAMHDILTWDMARASNKAVWAAPTSVTVFGLSGLNVFIESPK